MHTELPSPHSHIQLGTITDEDIDQILEAGAFKVSESRAIRSLLSDEEEGFHLLDQSRFQAIILEISDRLQESLVCFVRVRQRLTQVGLANLRTAIYLSQIWMNYRRNGILPKTGPLKGPVVETVDILREMNFLKGYEKFELLTMSGNYYLFLVAFFEDYFHELEYLNGRPNMAYYEAFARIAFRAARDHSLSAEFELTEVCHDLSENFSLIRSAISGLAERPEITTAH